MYTESEYERYSELLRNSGVTDEDQISSILDFVYRLAVIAADEYEDRNKMKENGKEKEISHRQARPD